MHDCHHKNRLTTSGWLSLDDKRKINITSAAIAPFQPYLTISAADNMLTNADEDFVKKRVKSDKISNKDRIMFCVESDILIFDDIRGIAIRRYPARMLGFTRVASGMS